MGIYFGCKHRQEGLYFGLLCWSHLTYISLYHVVCNIWSFSGFFNDFDILHTVYQIVKKKSQENVRYSDYVLCNLCVYLHTRTFPLLTKTMLIFHHVEFNIQICFHSMFNSLKELLLICWTIFLKLYLYGHNFCILIISSTCMPVFINFSNVLPVFIYIMSIYWLGLIWKNKNLNNMNEVTFFFR